MCLELIFSAFNCLNILYCELDWGDERPASCLPLHMRMEVHLLGETVGMESSQKSACCSVSNAPHTTYCNNGCEGLSLGSILKGAYSVVYLPSSVENPHS